MSQQQHHYSYGSSNSNIPVIEVYWSLVAKADKKFSKIRDLPYYQRNRLRELFFTTFDVLGFCLLSFDCLVFGYWGISVVVLDVGKSPAMSS